MRILHTMLRVGDLDRSIDFYSRVLGMKLLRKSPNEAYKYTLAFMGYGDEKEEAVLELTYNWGVDTYDLGTAFGHIAIEVDDIYKTCEAVRELGGNVTREPGPVKGGTTEIAFLEDPDGYKIELIQKKVRINPSTHYRSHFGTFSGSRSGDSKKEKTRARELRHSAWWKNQIGRGICYYCHERVHPSELTMDHKTPIARGGTSTKNNLVACCKACNSEKHYQTLSEWIAVREAEGRSLACAKDLLY